MPFAGSEKTAGISSKLEAVTDVLRGRNVDKAKRIAREIGGLDSSVDRGMKKLVKREKLKTFGARTLGVGAAGLGTAGAVHALKDKEASEIAKAKGVRRVAQLLSGSRIKALEGASASRAQAQIRNHASANNLFQEAFAGVNGLERQVASASRRTGAAKTNAERAMHLADKERVAVQGARTQAKRIGAGVAVGAGVGAEGLALAHQDHSQPGQFFHKEAFGAALAAGLKGMAQFGGLAAKSIGAAGKAGGVAAAGQAAANAGRSGLMRAGNFIAQNPGAGAAMVAAPALAAGYAAGRQ